MPGFNTYTRSMSYLVNSFSLSTFQLVKSQPRAKRFIVSKYLTSYPSELTHQPLLAPLLKSYHP
jgi:hypothetical protein